MRLRCMFGKDRAVVKWQGRHRKGYKFTEKTQSKRGMLSLLLSLASLGVFVAVIWSSFQHRGNGSMYLGSAGVSSMILAAVALVLALKSLGEENSFKFFPYLATICSFLTTGIWIALYVVGFRTVY